MKNNFKFCLIPHYKKTSSFHHPPFVLIFHLISIRINLHVFNVSTIIRSWINAQPSRKFCCPFTSPITILQSLYFFFVFTSPRRITDKFLTITVDNPWRLIFFCLEFFTSEGSICDDLYVTSCKIPSSEIVSLDTSLRGYNNVSNSMYTLQSSGI